MGETEALRPFLGLVLGDTFCFWGCLNLFLSLIIRAGNYINRGPKKILTEEVMLIQSHEHFSSQFKI